MLRVPWLWCVLLVACGGLYGGENPPAESEASVELQDLDRRIQCLRCQQRRLCRRAKFYAREGQRVFPFDKLTYRLHIARACDYADEARECGQRIKQLHALRHDGPQQ